MSKHRKRKYKNKYKLKERQQSNNFLVILLTLIVLVETILLLFLIPRSISTKKVSTKEVKVETKRVVSKPLKKPSTRKLEKKTLAKLEAILQKPRESVLKKTKGKIAIVIDDWGYNKKNLDILRQIKSPLTLAILPFRDYSRKIAEFGHKHNYEVIIHMPMEPEDKDRVMLEPKTLMTYMSGNTIKSILNDAFDNIVYAKGINNHMGSLATQDKEFVATVFKELKKKKFYFLDSYVVADSVAYDVSRKIGIRFTKRSIFLDNESDPEYIRNQLNKLAKEADKNGKAVGIGHDRRNTLIVLKDEIPKLNKQGYRFVFVSEIVE
ncbi:MAG: divergent polysaccharide deacetylase family protein [Candidatus Omnitrophica bacterium]|nr:divergent polysaccharide deacetylase family protein [Candidatus Omnitrophota bacterium]